MQVLLINNHFKSSKYKAKLLGNIKADGWMEF